MFHSLKNSELLKIRNNIFLEYAFSSLQKNGFIKSPFLNANFGKHNPQLYIYDMCRLTNSNLECITTYITSRDRYIKIYLNIFELSPKPENIFELKDIDGIKFYLPPNKKKEERLDIDMLKTIPLFSYRFWFENYKLKSFHTKFGLNMAIKKLQFIIERDMKNINYFIEKWHSFHKPNITDWEGNIIKRL
ncbi:hypothetical protein EPJ79_04150 [Brachyspira aalborgi]|uniref:Uncharacterized protein n=1 Tax=Brachyspira aalborgi TaxID=29522 RepID=A0A5C8D4D7_9SPIR|nr:hypothetical protein [Brachyspira aalborgi]TXJ20349.1 hypothetical protein EPJ79_04150 [Brachyspira aalborgi]